MSCFNPDIQMINPQLIYTHTILLLDAGSKKCFTICLAPCTIYRAKTSNITVSLHLQLNYTVYYSSPKH